MMIVTTLTFGQVVGLLFFGMGFLTVWQVALLLGWEMVRKNYNEVEDKENPS